MITVGRLAPKDQWDQNVLDRLFDNTLWPTGIDFRRVDGYPTKVDGCVLIIPGRYWHEKANAISEAISAYEWVLAVRTGDEENLFDVERVYHRNIKWWIQTPEPDVDYGDARLFGCGFPPHFNDLTRQPRDTDVFLSGQVTHRRREECFAAVRKSWAGKKLNMTKGFTLGMDRPEYVQWMCRAKVAPAPSGPESPDSFRLFEALEAHTIPIADDLSPKSSGPGFWRTVFPDAPFPIITDYQNLPGYVEDQLNGWPANANRITAWWITQKRLMAKNLRADLTELGAL